MILEKQPTVFISYSRSGSKKHLERVIKLAENLRKDGVDVQFDMWELQLGQDVNYFMESIPRCDKVLIICNRSYSQKADDRNAGVGAEFSFIVQEIKNSPKQTKYIPLVFEVDNAKNPYLPNFLKTRNYIDFSTDKQVEKNYTSVLKSIYDVPIYEKPSIGETPKWIGSNISWRSVAVKESSYIQNSNLINRDMSVWQRGDSFIMQTGSIPRSLLRFRIHNRVLNPLPITSSHNKPPADIRRNTSRSLPRGGLFSHKNARPVILLMGGEFIGLVQKQN
jgi:hypothetical protein